jgi:hypothetical protein
MVERKHFVSTGRQPVAWKRQPHKEAAMMSTGKHSIESLLLSLLNANIPAERLVGSLLCAGFRVDRKAIHRREGSGSSKAATLALIRQRIKLTRQLWEELKGVYENREGYVAYRSQEGTPVDGHFNPSIEEDEAVVLARAEKVFWHEEHAAAKARMLRLWRLERALIEAVKAGDRTPFDAALVS